MKKAAREAKIRTSWINVDSAYEEALSGFIGRLLADTEFTESLTDFVSNLLEPARISSSISSAIRS